MNIPPDAKIPNALLESLESIAKNVHEQWMAGRVEEGWTYGAERDDRLKQTPCIVPYESLSEEEKDYDRRTALRVIKSLIELGFNITKE